MSELVSWVYASASLLAASERDEAVSDIVAKSQSRNARLRISGALGFNGSHFFQVIEGPPAAVEDVQASIRRDPRHTSIETLYDGPCQVRRFSGWSLAYVGPARYATSLIQRSIDQADQELNRGALDMVRFLQGMVDA